jgi:hypothetical protein
VKVRYDGEGGGEGGAGNEGGAGKEGAGNPSLLNGGTGGAGEAGAGNTGGTPPAEFKLPDNWDYRTALPPELKESPSAKKYGSLPDLVRSLDSAQQMIGKPLDRLVEIPPNADATVRQQVMERLGLPKNLPDYKIEAVKGAEDHLKVDSPNMKALIEVAHKEGILPGQMQAVINKFGGILAEGHKTIEAAEIQRNADNVTALKTKWGEAFDGKVAAANFAVEKLGGDKAGVDALRESINRGGLGTDGPLLNMLATIGEMLNEGGEAGDKQNGIGIGMTPDNAKAEGMRLLNEAMNEKDQMKRRDLNAKAQEFFAKASKR